MKKRIVSVMALLCIFCALAAPSAAYAQEELIIEVTERVDFASEKEFTAFMIEEYGITFVPFAASGVSGDINGKTTSAKVIFTMKVYATGLASKVGAKDVYIRHRYVGDSAYVSQSAGEYFTTNATNYIGDASIGNPVSGKEYQFKGTYFAIINGTEYTCPIESEWVAFY